MPPDDPFGGGAGPTHVVAAGRSVRAQQALRFGLAAVGEQNALVFVQEVGGGQALAALRRPSVSVKLALGALVISRVFRVRGEPAAALGQAHDDEVAADVGGGPNLGID